MAHNYLRVAAASLPVSIGDPKTNATNIFKSLEKIENEGSVDIVVFPELCLTGYTCQDLFAQQKLLKESLIALQDLLQLTKKFSMVSIIGMPLEVSNRLYNVAVVIYHGEILGIVPKTYLPNYQEFYEQRWFASAKAAIETDVTLFGDFIPFGSLIFSTGTGIKWGIEICEDLWSIIPPSSKMAAEGAQVIFNLSASNELVGKADYRRELVKHQSGRLLCAYVYASAGPGESASDTVFSGHCLIAENDTILAESKRFCMEGDTIIRDISISELNAERQHNTTFTESDRAKEFTVIEYSHKHTLDEVTLLKYPEVLLRDIKSMPFVPEKESVRQSVCDEIINIQSTALQRRITNKWNVVIGVSGGLDSTLALLIAVDAMDKLKRSRKDIIGVTLPALGTTKRTKSNALSLMQSLGITCKTINISKPVNSHLKEIKHKKDTYDITFENAQARYRSLVLFDLANQHNAILLGTGDLSEIAQGWMTYGGGDSESHLHINAGVPKTLIRYLIESFAQDVRYADQKAYLIDIYNTPISPELLPAKEGKVDQFTEKSIGPYELLDFILYWTIRKGCSPEVTYINLKKAWGEKYSNKELLHWLKSFYTRFFNSQFKRNSAPDGIKIGSMSLSQRADWRMPSDMQGNLWTNTVDNIQALLES